MMTSRKWMHCFLPAILLLVLAATHVLAIRPWWRRSQLTSPTRTSVAPATPLIDDTHLTLPPASPIIDKPVNKPTTDDVVEDILSIRAATSGTADACESCEFADALRAVVTGEVHPAAPLRSRDWITFEVRSELSADQTATVAALRKSARHFDTIAADAEDREDYDSADVARRTAESLRHEARQVGSQALIECESCLDDPYGGAGTGKVFPAEWVAPKAP